MDCRASTAKMSYVIGHAVSLARVPISASRLPAGPCACGTVGPPHWVHQGTHARRHSMEKRLEWCGGNKIK